MSQDPQSQEAISEAPCQYCGRPTSEQIAGDPICLDCYSTQGACCAGDDE